MSLVMLRKCFWSYSWEEVFKIHFLAVASLNFIVVEVVWPDQNNFFHLCSYLHVLLMSELPIFPIGELRKYYLLWNCLLKTLKCRAVTVLILAKMQRLCPFFFFFPNICISCFRLIIKAKLKHNLCPLFVNHAFQNDDFFFFSATI